MARRKTRQPVDPTLAELGAIKRLLILQLLANGVQAQTIGTVLGLTKSAMSAIIPARKLKLKNSG